MPDGDTMGLLIPVIVVLTHVIVPLLLAGWLALTRADSRLQLAAICAVAISGTVVLVLTQIGSSGPSWFLRWFWVLALAAGLARVAYRWARTSWLPDPPNVWGWVATVGLCVLGLGTTYLAARTATAVATARSHVGSPVDLVFPLRGGTFFVYFGGGNATVNPNHRSRGLRYALDIGALNALGMNATGIFPADVQAYAVYDARVVAPCGGTVAVTLDGLPDLTPGDFDLEHPFGNHVLLHCDTVSVVLAHLRAGTIAAEQGGNVSAGDEIGRVGNSGATMLPHLHLHAVRGLATDAAGLREQEPVPMRFDGRFLVQFDTVVSP